MKEWAIMYGVGDGTWMEISADPDLEQDKLDKLEVLQNLVTVETPNEVKMLAAAIYGKPGWYLVVPGDSWNPKEIAFRTTPFEVAP